jgi:CrcB protein
MPGGDLQVWQRLALLALAGAAGTLARYGIAAAIARWQPLATFPWGTLAVNAVGCFLFGLVWSLAEERMLISAATRLILLAGFMAAFTTFSSFAFETTYLVREMHYLSAAANVVAQNVGGMLLVLLGMAAARVF